MRLTRIVFPVAVLAALSFTLPAATAAKYRGGDPLVDKIVKARKQTNHWRKVMQRSPMKPHLSPLQLSRRTADANQRALERWRFRAERAERNARNPPHKREFLCIHRHEGPWDANTGNGYYGGLQMDISFQRAYGPRLLRKKGRAHRWSRLEQIWVAERAYRSGRGFYPWPNTARYCGLI